MLFQRSSKFQTSMANQTGSVILILLIVITLSGISSVLALQSNLSLIKQINLTKLHQLSRQITSTETNLESKTIISGINLNSLPITNTKEHHFSNHSFRSSQTTRLAFTLDSPLNGYSVNNNFYTQLVELITNTQSSMIKSNSLINGFACLSVINETISNQIDSIYSLDLDTDSVTDVSYQFDSSDGEINTIESTTELFIDFDLDIGHSFGRPSFAIFNFETDTKLSLAFIVQNINPSTPTADNTLYLVFDVGLFSSQIEIPIDPNDLIDINSNPVFSTTHKGYFLNLDPGQLISSAITLFNQKIIFITQLPSIDPNTGSTEYTNKLISIDFDIGSPITPDIQFIASSNDLLELKLNTLNQQTITLSSQFGSLLNLSSECRQLYSYEN